MKINYFLQITKKIVSGEEINKACETTYDQRYDNQTYYEINFINQVRVSVVSGFLLKVTYFDIMLQQLI